MDYQLEIQQKYTKNLGIKNFKSMSYKLMILKIKD